MRDLFGLLHRGGPQGQGIHFAYEKAGLLIRNEPIAWSAEAVVVEALVRAPNGATFRKHDFSLRLADRPPLSSFALHRQSDDHFQLLFRFPSPERTATAEVHWQSRLIG